MTTATKPALRRGGEAAKAREVADKAERDAKRGNRSYFNSYEYLRLAPPADGQVRGGSAIVRLVTDEPELIETKQHSWVKTKPAPADKPADKKWLDKTGAVCRYTEDQDGNTLHPDCYICDKMRVPSKNGKEYAPYAATRLWAVGCLREEIIGTKEMADEGLIEAHEVGAVIAIVDATYEKSIWEDGKDTGKTETRKKYVILNFGMNFFDDLLGYNNVHKTLVDRDYKITRIGAGTDTSYSIIALDPVEDVIDGKSVKWDLRNPTVRAEYEYDFDLLEVALEQASDEHYGWYFDPRVESSWEARFGKKEDKPKPAATESAPATAAQDADTKDTLDKIRARMRKASQPA